MPAADVPPAARVIELESTGSAAAGGDAPSTWLGAGAAAGLGAGPAAGLDPAFAPSPPSAPLGVPFGAFAAFGSNISIGTESRIGIFRSLRTGRTLATSASESSRGPIPVDDGNFSGAASHSARPPNSIIETA